MNAELDYTVMQHHASELRHAAAEQRQVREAAQARRSDRRHRSILPRFLTS